MEQQTNNKSSLSTRQWMLYRFLKKQYPRAEYISKKEICDNLPQCYEINQNQTRVCRAIEVDIRAINESEEIQKIIVSNSKGYKIGTIYDNTHYKRTDNHYKQLTIFDLDDEFICLEKIKRDGVVIDEQH